MLANGTVAVDAMALSVEEGTGTVDIAADETLLGAGAATTKEANRIALRQTKETIVKVRPTIQKRHVYIHTQIPK